MNNKLPIIKQIMMLSGRSKQTRSTLVHMLDGLQKRLDTKQKIVDSQLKIIDSIKMEMDHIKEQIS